MLYVKELTKFSLTSSARAKTSHANDPARVVPSQGWFYCTPRTVSNVRGISAVTTRAMLLASGGEKPEILVNNLQCNAQDGLQRRYQPQMSIVPQFRNSSLKFIIGRLGCQSLLGPSRSDQTGSRGTDLNLPFCTSCSERTLYIQGL